MNVDRAMFPFEIDDTLGLASWDWPLFPACKQKLTGTNMFDPGNRLFKAGSHMPIVSVLGDASAGRRKADKVTKRADRAKQRRWDKARIDAHRRAQSGSGRGGGNAAGKSAKPHQPAGMQEIDQPPQPAGRQESDPGCFLKPRWRLVG